jgi:hypothetical protein
VLERFLALAVTLVGIPIRYNSEVVGLCESAPENNSDGETLVAVKYGRSRGYIGRTNDCAVPSPDADSLHRFDVVISAGGRYCKVRRALEEEPGSSGSSVFFPAVSFERQDSFTLSSGAPIAVKNLNQTSLIVFFDADPQTGQCPTVIEEDGIPLSPLHASFTMPALGVTSVWKRFYLGHCSLQLLFSREKGEKLMDRFRSHAPASIEAMQEDPLLRDPSWQVDAFPWADLLSVWNMLIHEKVGSVQELRDRVSRRGRFPHLFDITLFPIVIRAAVPTVALANRPHSHSRDGAEKRGHYLQHQVFFIRGDAAVTPHYRLGVGINNAFVALAESARFYQALTEAFLFKREKASEEGTDIKTLQLLKNAVQEAERASSKRISRMIQFQLSTMFYEAYCDLVVGYDMESSEFGDEPFQFWDTQHLSWKNLRRKTVVPIQGDVSSFCDA